MAGQGELDIARTLSINETTVIDHLNRVGVKRRLRRINETQIEEAVRLYASGQSLARIGERLGFNASTVQSRL